MSQSVWSLSGGYWIRSVLSWIAFAAVISVLPQSGALGSDSAPETGDAAPLARFAFANPAMAAGLPSRLITRSIKPLDLDRLTEAQFGDVLETHDAR